LKATSLKVKRRLDPKFDLFSFVAFSKESIQGIRISQTLLLPVYLYHKGLGKFPKKSPPLWNIVKSFTGLQGSFFHIHPLDK
jgi:hypothetical protein